ncbi:MAG TPA: hypothetical protein P5144_16110 [Thermoanaerobaculia bacterium]|nr:hypothetical protein [Thermoanaerobaculia bacterium]HRU10902.1 hypothetical protein [Thermoanaerobaculia bacterium]
MTTPAPATRQETPWREGPPKWLYTAYAVGLATIHLALAGLDVGKFFDLFDLAWPFYGTLIAITSGSAVALHLGRRRAARSPFAYGGDSQPYHYDPEGSFDDTRDHDLDLPAPPRR